MTKIKFTMSCFCISAVSVEPTQSLTYMLKKFEPDDVIIDHIKRFPKCINDADDDGKTALMWAVEKGRTLIAVRLLRLKANIEAVDSDGWSATMYAARRGNKEALQVLLDLGADVTVKTTEDDFTALHLACGNELVEIAQMLIKAGADPMARDDCGRNALYYMKLAKNKDKVSETTTKILQSGKTPEDIRKTREDTATEKSISMTLDKFPTSPTGKTSNEN